MLLDFLVDGGNELYYAGDLDPEGLGMAGRLLERYEGAVRLWHMDVEAYQKSKPVTELSAERLEKLNSIQNDRLVEIANEMRRIGKAGYQEALVDLMVADITYGVLLVGLTSSGLVYTIVLTFVYNKILGGPFPFIEVIFWKQLLI